VMSVGLDNDHYIRVSSGSSASSNLTTVYNEKFRIQGTSGLIDFAVSTSSTFIYPNIGDCLTIRSGNQSTASKAGDLDLCGGYNSLTGCGGDVCLEGGISCCNDGGDICLRGGTTTCLAGAVTGDIYLKDLPSKSTETSVVFMDANGKLACGAAGGGTIISGTDNHIPIFNTAGDNIEDTTLTFTGKTLYNSDCLIIKAADSCPIYLDAPRVGSNYGAVYMGALDTAINITTQRLQATGLATNVGMQFLPKGSGSISLLTSCLSVTPLGPATNGWTFSSTGFKIPQTNGKICGYGGDGTLPNACPICIVGGAGNGTSNSGYGGDVCLIAGNANSSLGANCSGGTVVITAGSGINAGVAGRVRITNLPSCVSETCTVFIDASGNLSTGVGTGGGGGFTASNNGLCDNGTTVGLGGTLANDTTIDGNSYASSLYVVDALNIGLSAITTTICGNFAIEAGSGSGYICGCGVCFGVGALDANIQSSSGNVNVSVPSECINMCAKKIINICGINSSTAALGGAINILAGCGSSTGNGGTVTIAGGTTTGLSIGGHVCICGGVANNPNAGCVFIKGGDSTNNTGGGICLCAGQGGGTTAGGNIGMQTQDNGDINLCAGTGCVRMANTNTSTTSAVTTFAQCVQIAGNNGTNIVYGNFNGNGIGGNGFPTISFTVLSGATSSSQFQIQHCQQEVFGCVANFKGITYCADFSGNYTNRSLVDCAYVASQVSDCRLKCCLQPISISIDTLCGYSYEFNEITKCDNCCGYGFVAQEVEEILPFAIKNDSREIDGICYMGIDYVQLVPALWNIVKEQEVRIKVLEAKINL